MPLSKLCRLIPALAVAGLLLHGCGGTGERTDDSGARREVVGTAMRQIGTPYRWGGASPAEGFDCSGLVQYAHGSAGVRVPRVAAAQLEAAQTVGREGARPGDLVFFKVGASDYHVGILVEPGRFVHAPRSGKEVRLSALDSSYWARHFVGAGSFLN